MGEKGTGYKKGNNQRKGSKGKFLVKTREEGGGEYSYGRGMKHWHLEEFPSYVSGFLFIRTPRRESRGKEGGMCPNEWPRERGGQGTRNPKAIPFRLR